MKGKFFVWALVGLFACLALSFAQMKPAEVKAPALGKTYWCAEVEDILINPQNFTTADSISVGVRIKLWKQTIVLGAPRIKKCSCAIEPKRVATDYWQAIVSLRLIGIKYSETETNLLEYHGPTPSFPVYNYSGFPVIGFVVSNKDVERGYIDVWGWVPRKNPLKDNREFTIYASFDANGYPLKRDNDPDYLRNGCFPPHAGKYEGDFRKTFKPGELKVPEIKREKIEKGAKFPELLKNLPDLKIAGVETDYKIGGENRWGVQFDDFTMKIPVQNAGNVNISKFKILVERKNEGENQYYSEKYSGWAYERSHGTIENGIIEVENLKAGETKNIFVYADNSRSPKADCWFRITLDPDNEVAELDESNNGVSEIYFPNHYAHPEYYKKKGFKAAPAKAK